VPAPAPAAPTAPTPDHFAMALYYQRVGDFDGALAQYRRLLEQNDASAEVHNNLGLLYQDRGQYDEAVKQFQRSIAIDPKYIKAHNNLGVALMRSNRPDAAAAEFRVALAADPRNVESLVNLALVRKAAGRVADARDLLRRALLVEDRELGADLRGELLVELHAPGVGGDDDEVGQAEVVEVLREHEQRRHVVDGVAEEPLDLARVEIHRQDAVDSGKLEHVGDETRRDRLTTFSLAILS
jgi:tetratricopeptide (TPR) repeat protein